MNPKRNNVKAGILVIGAILLATVTVIVLANSVEILGTRRYEVRFPLRTGAPGLQTGSVVMLGGQPVGTVWSIGFVDSPSGTPEHVRVIMRIKDTVPLHEDALVMLERPLLGTQSAINIVGLGSGTPLAEDAWIEGDLAPPSLLAQAGYGKEQAEHLRQILSSTRTITERVEDIIAEFGDQDMETIRATLADSRETAARAREIADDLKGRYDSWADSADEIMERAPRLAESMQARLDELGRLIEEGQELVEANRPRIDETIENARAISAETRELVETFNDEGRAKVLAMLDEGRATITDARATLTRVDGLLVEQTPNVRASMASARIAADQLREAMVEIRRTPWRLLFRPDTQELEHELLYESARRYAGAVSDLRAVADALQAVAGVETSTGAQQSSVAELLSLLQESFEACREAEDAFIRQLTEDPS